MRRSLKYRRIQCTIYSEEVILIEERKWNDILACQHFRGHTFEAEVSKLDGAVHWNSMGPKLRKSISEGWKAKILGLRLSSVHSRRMQQN